MDRLKAFFDEDEVPEDIGGLTRAAKKEPEELSIQNGTFKWTTGGSKSTDSDKASSPSAPASSVGTNDVADDAATTASVSTRTAVGQNEQVFELKDINIRITPRKLTVSFIHTSDFGRLVLIFGTFGTFVSRS